MNDMVNKPSHYTDGKIEVIEYIEDKQLGFCLGNAVKYISRAGKKYKDKEIEDLEKAIWYINRRIKELQEEKNGTITVNSPKEPAVYDMSKDIPGPVIGPGMGFCSMCGKWKEVNGCDGCNKLPFLTCIDDLNNTIFNLGQKRGLPENDKNN